MNSLPTRFFCAMLSIVGAAGLVVLSSPAVAVGGTPAKIPVTTIAAASTMLLHHG